MMPKTGRADESPAFAYSAWPCLSRGCGHAGIAACAGQRPAPGLNLERRQRRSQAAPTQHALRRPPHSGPSGTDQAEPRRQTRPRRGVGETRRVSYRIQIDRDVSALAHFVLRPGSLQVPRLSHKVSTKSARLYHHLHLGSGIKCFNACFCKSPGRDIDVVT
jgi:hypothetical protein